MTHPTAALRRLALAAFVGGALFCLASPHGAVSWAAVPGGPPTFSDPLTITNPGFPFAPNGVKVFTGVKDGGKSLLVDVYLPTLRAVRFDNADVECHTMQETEFVDGLRVEISENYFAQADDGGVYYMGEIVDVYDRTGAITSHEGSWLVGGPTLVTDPAGTITGPPGLRMPAAPAVGDVFYSENAPPDLYEKDTVKSVTAKTRVPGARVRNAVEVQETSLPDLHEAPETKLWVPGIGVASGHTKGETFRLVATTFIAAK